MKDKFSKLKRIAIIITYFGKEPWFFKFFINSCQYNPTVDFFIVTDNVSLTIDLPNNIKSTLMTLSDFNDIASKKLGIETNIEYPYKLCDFKPTLGLLFSDMLKDYDFWGQCDIDLIFGNIREFVNNEILDRYDFINVRHDYTTGCFFIVRNNNLLNRLFSKSKDWKKVLTSKRYFGFDECSFAHHLLNNGKTILEIDTDIESFSHVVMAADRNNLIKAYFDFILIEGVTGRIRIDNGRVIYKNKFEAILYHLVKFKEIYSPKSRWKKLPKVYHISNTKIY